MNKKIKGIAQGIVDKWVAEGLTVTREKVEGWLNILEKSQTKDKNEKGNSKVGTSTEVNNIENLEDDFKQVRGTVITTFSNIGKAKCETCKKTHVKNKHQNETPNGKNQLESLSVEELKQKQQAINQFMQLQKMSQLAKLSASFSELDKLKDIAGLAKTLQTLTTPREEL